MGRLHVKIIKKINTIFNTSLLYYHYPYLYIEREFLETNVMDLSFLFIFLSRWINSNKLELTHLHKNMKNTLTLNFNVRLKVTFAF